MRIYADFSDLGARMPLSYTGTLRDLSRQRIRLEDGMPLVLYDGADGDTEMEVDAVAEYQPAASSNPQLRWFAIVRTNSLRRLPVAPPLSNPFVVPCFSCSADTLGAIVASKTAEIDCPSCGRPILAAYIPTGSAPNYRLERP